MVGSARRRTSSFFFTSFSDKVAAKELYDVFGEHGEVDEVIIPGRRDKYGKRFSFVRFFDVLEEECLAVKLVNILIGDQKLFVNIPRFQRGKKVQEGERVAAKGKAKVSVRMEQKRVDNMFFSKGGYSFVAMVHNRLDLPVSSATGLVYNCDTSEAMQIFSKAFVGKVFEVA